MVCFFKIDPTSHKSPIPVEKLIAHLNLNAQLKFVHRVKGKRKFNLHDRIYFIEIIFWSICNTICLDRGPTLLDRLAKHLNCALQAT